MNKWIKMATIIPGFKTDKLAHINRWMMKNHLKEKIETFNTYFNLYFYLL